ncbi:RteC domain-containing protein [Mucilaginibacter sp. UR6-11]|uniref:RteC domain-containing protein n=1 Tax=Mucilaginibacter sp. UR6-11 TaxID=1435644 RepID=UPI001E58C391|nr:RteC domain-containing protein [Mucilaginibacter sp. UR6-11]MCC8423611.1 RteC domain-containing protein [Mucilaginibacter sp. UR6-11]
MKTITERFYSAMENQLAEITLSGESLTEQYKASIKICKKAMSKLKNYISSYAFENKTEEVHFFKEIKPKFYSKYIYFINIHNFLLQKPTGGERIQRDYIEMHLAELKTFFDHNRAFYSYYRSGMTQMDESYYTRGSFDVHAELEDFEEDEQYSTTHDYKLAKIIANEKFQDYLKLELAKIGNEDLATLIGQKVFPFNHPQWTASQTDAAELLYSLKTSCAVNNGNIDINELVAIWEFVFQMEINEPYHKLLDVVKRQREMFVFLNRLKNSLWNFIKEKFKKGLPPDMQ